MSYLSSISSYLAENPIQLEQRSHLFEIHRFLYILTFLAEIAVLDRNNELLWVKGMAEVSYRISNSPYTAENPIQHEQRSHLLEIHNLPQPVSVMLYGHFLQFWLSNGQI